ncbi:MAG: hypothetical protein V4537_04855 [Pseudomonadota bacterium]
MTGFAETYDELARSALELESFAAEKLSDPPRTTSRVQTAPIKGAAGKSSAMSNNETERFVRETLH